MRHMLDNPLDYRSVTIDGVDLYVHPVTGRVLPVVTGGDEGENGDGDGGEGGDGQEGRTFTQADVDRLVGRARTEARRVAASELADQLGCSVDEAREVIDGVRAATAEQESAADRARREADEARQQADQARTEAARERLTARIERRLIRAGVTDTAIDRATRLVDVTPDADDTEIDTEIDALRADIPGLFTPDPAGQPAPPGVTPPRRPNSGTGGKSPLDAGAERYRAEHPAPAA